MNEAQGMPRPLQIDGKWMESMDVNRWRVFIDEPFIKNDDPINSFQCEIMMMFNSYFNVKLPEAIIICEVIM